MSSERAVRLVGCRPSSFRHVHVHVHVAVVPMCTANAAAWRPYGLCRSITAKDGVACGLSHRGLSVLQDSTTLLRGSRLSGLAGLANGLHAFAYHGLNVCSLTTSLATADILDTIAAEC